MCDFKYIRIKKQKLLKPQIFQKVSFQKAEIYFQICSQFFHYENLLSLYIYISVVKQFVVKLLMVKYTYLIYSYLSASTWCLAWCHSSNFSTPLHSKVTPLDKKTLCVLPSQIFLKYKSLSLISFYKII